MGKFAAIYDLPAGEQMLVTVFDNADGVPVVQYATEVNGELISAEIPLCDRNDNLMEKLAARVAARNVIFDYDEEDIKEFRRRFVRGDDVVPGQEQLQEGKTTCLPN